MSRAVRRAATTLAATLLLAVVASAGAMYASGWRMYEIRTGSMTPTMPAGDAVLDRPTHAVHTGDIVTYRGGPDGYTTHRVVAVTQAGVETKGDANRSPDWGYRSNADIAGHVVVRLPYGGYVLRFGHSHSAIAGLLLLIAGLFTWPPRRRAAPAQREPIAAS